MNKGFNKFVFLTVTGDSLGVAWQLHRKGKEVIVGFIDDLRTIGKELENTDDYRRRTSAYSGILNVQKAEKLVEKMRSFPDKEEWFVFVDFNYMWEFADKIQQMGFINGLFPSKFDYKLEADRKFGKEFVEKFYPDVKVAELFEFKTNEEAEEFLADTDEFWALKGNDPDALTVVPETKILEHANEEIISALHSNDAFTRKGFILERQIRDGVEVCAELISYHGEPVVSSIDLENKAMGGDNVGIKLGCAMDVVVDTPMDCKLNSIAFPDAMKKVAKKHKGMHFADLNMIIKDGEPYFIEHCGNRPGYDSLVTECEMSGGADNFFNKISAGENPFLKKYGVAVRGSNLSTDSKDNKSKGGMDMRWLPEIEDHIYPFEMKKENGRYVNTGSGWDLIVFTEASDDVEYAIHKAYDVIGKFSFKEMFYRSREDFLSKNYTTPTSILTRLDGVESFISSSEVEEEDK